MYVVNNTANDLSVGEVRDIKIHPQMDSKRLLISNLFKLYDDTHRHIHYVVKAAVESAKLAVEANFSFVVNSPPKKKSPQQSCDVRPKEGEAVSTNFLITCWGWQDVDTPLTYQFRYRDEYGMVLIQSGSLYNVSTKLPIGDAAEGYTLILEALVGDSFKDFTSTKLLVKVNKIQIALTLLLTGYSRRLWVLSICLN